MSALRTAAPRSRRLPGHSLPECIGDPHSRQERTDGPIAPPGGNPALPPYESGAMFSVQLGSVQSTGAVPLCVRLWNEDTLSLGISAAAAR